MKLTKKTVKHETETTELVCEITHEEFDQICAETVASEVVKMIGDEPDIDDLIQGMRVVDMFARFVAKLDTKLFTDKTENPDKKEEK